MRRTIVTLIATCFVIACGDAEESPPVTCGNGVVDEGEQCDDGNANGTEASNCTKNCKTKKQEPDDVKGPKIGQYYFSDGTFSDNVEEGKTCVGIVFRGKSAKQKALVVSHDIKENSGWWMPVTPTGFVYKLVGANDKDDGTKNLEKVKKWSEWEKWYPAFSWCTAKGEGWYLPAINELKDLSDIMTENTELRNKLEAIPGAHAFEMPSYWSSTEESDSSALTFVVKLGTIVARNKTYAKTSNVSVRAVRAF